MSESRLRLKNKLPKLKEDLKVVKGNLLSEGSPVKDLRVGRRLTLSMDKNLQGRKIDPKRFKKPQIRTVFQLSIPRITYGGKIVASFTGVNSHTPC